MSSYGTIMGIGLVALILGLRYLFSQKGPKTWLHTLYLKTLGFRKMVQNVDSARMARTLSIMVGSGVPILSSMRASEGVMTNMVLQKDLHVATEEVAQGVPIGMVTSGENSGRLGHMLEKAATATENEMQTRVGMMVSLLGPMMILIMGSLVLTIILAILLPMSQLNSLINV